MGRRVFLGNPRKLRFIWDSLDKSDERDARILGMVCHIEPRLQPPPHYRGSQAQADLTMIKSRSMLVKSRSQLINHARGVVKGTKFIINSFLFYSAVCYHCTSIFLTMIWVTFCHCAFASLCLKDIIIDNLCPPIEYPAYCGAEHRLSIAQ